MTDDRSLLLEAVAEVARVAGKIALGYFKSRVVVETKADGSPVTIADRTAEDAARSWIASRFPGDAIEGEERGANSVESHRRWIIDPIDGTKAFVRGVPLWGSLVAVCEGSEVIAGAASFPAVGEELAAAVERGAWWNGARCLVSSVDSMADATVLTTNPQFRLTPDLKPGWDRLAAAARVARGWGDCYGYLLVATGRAEVMVDGALADWDAAALYPVIVEAGGVFTDRSGRRTPFGKSAVATNAALATDARRLLGVPTAQEKD
jgi:histidinol phosphatase-like enzyme (inositol monophosphatase family)